MKALILLRPLRLKCASSRLLTSISSPWCLLRSGLPTLTTRQVSCHNFTAIRCRSQRSAIARAGGHPQFAPRIMSRPEKATPVSIGLAVPTIRECLHRPRAIHQVSGNYLIYGIASQALYRTRPDTDRGIDLIIGADWTPRDKSRNNQDLTVGLRLNEPMPVPFHHTIGIAYGRSVINRSFPGSSALMSVQPAGHAFEANILLGLPHGFSPDSYPIPR
jgi:hypothetical protein